MGLLACDDKQDLKKPVNKHIKIRCKNHFELALRIGWRYSGIVIEDEHRSYAEPLLTQRFLLFLGVLKAWLLLLFQRNNVQDGWVFPLEMGRARNRLHLTDLPFGHIWR